MNRKDRTATLLLAGLLALALGIPCAAAAEDPPATEKKKEEKGHDMSPEAQLLPGTPGAELFGPEPFYDVPYDADAQLAIYGGKHMNKTAFPPIDLGLQLYERGAYDPRPTWLGTKNPMMPAVMAYGDLRVAAAAYNNGIPDAKGKTDHSEVAARLRNGKPRPPGRPPPPQPRHRHGPHRHRAHPRLRAPAGQEWIVHALQFRQRGQGPFRRGAQLRAQAPLLRRRPGPDRHGTEPPDQRARHADRRRQGPHRHAERHLDRRRLRRRGHGPLHRQEQCGARHQQYGPHPLRRLQ